MGPWLLVVLVNTDLKKRTKIKDVKPVKLRNLGGGGLIKYVKNKYKARQVAKQAKIDEELKRKEAEKAEEEAVEKAAAEKKEAIVRANMQERKRRNTLLNKEYISNLLKQLQNTNYIHDESVIELLKDILNNSYTKYKHIDTIGKLEDAMRAHAMDHAM